MAEDRQHHPLAPVDVEHGRVFARLPVLENVHPPQVLIARHAHVVGDDIDDEAQAMRLERLD
jgi:hypothetical protein